MSFCEPRPELLFRSTHCEPRRRGGRGLPPRTRPPQATAHRRVHHPSSDDPRHGAPSPARPVAAGRARRSIEHVPLCINVGSTLNGPPPASFQAATGGWARVPRPKAAISGSVSARRRTEDKGHLSTGPPPLHVSATSSARLCGAPGGARGPAPGAEEIARDRLGPCEIRDTCVCVCMSAFVLEAA